MFKMSSNTEMIDLYEIIAPELSDTSYGNSIKERFDKINDNFKKLANSGFLRGVQGESIKVSKILLNESDEIGKKWLDAIKNKIIESYKNDPSLLNPIYINNNQINWYDRIINKYIYVYSSIIENEDDSIKIVSMLPFTLKDARYDFDNFLNEENKSPYKNIEDVSCIIGFNGEFDDFNNPIIELINNIPTIYFDTLSGAFCWKIWGERTGLIASGPKGENGENGDLIICIRGNVSDGDNYNIIQVLSNGNRINITDQNYSQYKNKPAIILPGESENNVAGFWVSTLNIKDGIDGLYAICADYNNILTKLTIDSEYFINNIIPDLTSYFLKFTDRVFNIKKSRKSDKDITVIDNTRTINSPESISGDLNIKLNTIIEPINEDSGGANNALEVINSGIFITLNGTRYSLSVGDGGNLIASKQ